MSMEELRRIIAPPDEPVATGSPELWTEVEKRLGTELPADYKDYISQYGAGGFYNFLEISSPFAKRSSSNIIEDVEFLKTLNFRRPLFPQPGGLLRFGGDENGNILFWKTIGLPDSWPVVYTTADWLAGAEEPDDYEEFPTTVTGFLAGWLSGRIQPRVIEQMHVLERSAPPFEASRFE